MRSKVFLLSLLTVALLFSTVAFPASAVVGVYNQSLGDLNVDGKVNSIDYRILKCYVLKTYSLRDSLLYSADLNYYPLNYSCSEQLYWLRENFQRQVHGQQLCPP